MAVNFAHEKSLKEHYNVKSFDDATRRGIEAALTARQESDLLAESIALSKDETEEKARQDHKDYAEKKRTADEFAELNGEERNNGLTNRKMTVSADNIQNANSSNSKRKKKDKEDIAALLRLEMQLEAMQRNLAVLQAEYDQLDVQIKECDAKLEAVDDLQDLVANGELDPNNPAHQDLLRQAGIPEDQWHRVTADSLETHRLALQKARDALAAKQKEIKREIDEGKQEIDAAREKESALKERLKEGKTPEEIEQLEKEIDEARQERKAELTENRNKWRSNKDLESTDLVEDTSNHDADQTIKGVLDIDQEIEHFQKGIAEANLLENGMEKLAAQKALVDNLSEDARFELSYTPETKPLFQDGYFDALGVVDNTVKMAQAIEPKSDVTQDSTPAPTLTS